VNWQLAAAIGAGAVLTWSGIFGGPDLGEHEELARKALGALAIAGLVWLACQGDAGGIMPTGGKRISHGAAAEVIDFAQRAARGSSAAAA
jgi:hypothetical protein